MKIYCHQCQEQLEADIERLAGYDKPVPTCPRGHVLTSLSKNETKWYRRRLKLWLGRKAKEDK